jgi:hypothetical protein
MKLPLIKNLVEYIEENSTEDLETTASVLENLAGARGLKENEEEIIGELLSNIFGALEVHSSIQEGTDKKTALNSFMKRVLGSVDKP